MATNKIIGIDLGTTLSVVAVMEGSVPKVLINSSGSRLTPSVVGFTDKGEILVGQLAKHQQVTNPENTVYSIKRFMGRRSIEVAAEEKLVPYKVVGGPNDLVKVEIRGKQYTPPEISAMILQDLKKTAETYLGDKVERAVITVPAYFNDAQRQATKDAGTIAGLKVERIINEPTAAALAYGLEKKRNEKVAVFDFGGGTFDISILDIGDNVFEVLSTNGDTHLGGDDLDAVLVSFLAEEFRKKEGIDLLQDPMAHQRLLEASEKAKIELSSQLETTVNLPFITADQSGPKHLQISITRSKFESLCEHVFERLKNPCYRAIEDAKRDISRFGTLCPCYWAIPPSFRSFRSFGRRPIPTVLDPPLVHQQPIKHPFQIEVLHRLAAERRRRNCRAGGCQFDSASTASILTPPPGAGATPTTRSDSRSCRTRRLQPFGAVQPRTGRRSGEPA